MMFDIRSYKKPTGDNGANNEDPKMYWAQKFLTQVDANIANINRECQELLERRNLNSKDAFDKKIDYWGDFTEALKNLCKIYKLYDAECLQSPEN